MNLAPGVEALAREARGLERLLEVHAVVGDAPVNWLERPHEAPGVALSLTPQTTSVTAIRDEPKRQVSPRPSEPAPQSPAVRRQPAAEPAQRAAHAAGFEHEQPGSLARHELRKLLGHVRDGLGPLAEEAS